MVRLTPPCSPGFSTRTTTTTGGGGPGLSLIHSINSFCTKLIKRSSSAMKSPRSPKKLFMTFSNKVIVFKQRKKTGRHGDVDDDGGEIDSGLWQKGILLGDKCQPPDFSGVIYYDVDGKQLPEFPMKSPRASPLPSYLYGTPAK